MNSKNPNRRSIFELRWCLTFIVLILDFLETILQYFLENGSKKNLNYYI